MFRKWESPEAVFQILKQLSRGRPCDITGVEDYHMLEPHGGVQWPFSQSDARSASPAPQRQWHTQTRTGKSSLLRQLSPQEVYVEINPEDTRSLRIDPDELVLVESRRGSLLARAFLTPCVQRGQVFIPMHYDSVNQLTDPVFDPYSHQPSYKACAVRVRKPEHWER